MSPPRPAPSAPQAPSAPERLLDLLALLLSRSRPWMPAEIFASLPDGYAGDREAQERKFRRDREELESLGIPLRYVDGREESDHGYRVDASAAWLPELQLAPEEQAGLFAVGAAALEGGAPLPDLLRGALVKLRAGWSRTANPSPPVVYVARPAPPHLARVTEAVSARRLVRVSYAGQERLFAPYCVARSRGRLLVIGHCHLRGAIRSFHVDRIAACTWAEDGPGPDYEIPASFEARDFLIDQPWQLPVHEPVEVTLSFAPSLLELGPRMLGLSPGRSCLTTNLDGLVAQLLSMGDGATIVAPPEARSRLCAIAAEFA
jgi:predicted DNA-binding transcriptional regulator YafY